MNSYTNLQNLKRATIRIALITIIIAVFANINLYSQYKRNIIFEEFTEVWCGPCALVTPMLTKWFENHPDYIPIAYYSYFLVNGAIQYVAKDEYTARSDFYAVPFYPFAVINAEKAPNTNWPGYPTDTTAINSIIDTMATTTQVKVVIDFTNNGATGKVKVDVTSDVALDNKYLRVIIVEKYHKYDQQPNGLSEFRHIMRRVLPKDGEKFSIKAGETLRFEYDYTLPNDLNYDLFAIAIVQDNSTKNIYQSESVFKQDPNSVNESNSTNNLTILPNPASYSDIILKYTLKNAGNVIISIYNSSGMIAKNIINLYQIAGDQILSIPTNDFCNGLYILELKSGKLLERKSFVIMK